MSGGSSEASRSRKALKDVTIPDLLHAVVEHVAHVGPVGRRDHAAGHHVAGVADIAAAPRPTAPLAAGRPGGCPRLRCAAAGDRHPAPRQSPGPARRSARPARIVFEQPAIARTRASVRSGPVASPPKSWQRCCTNSASISHSAANRTRSGSSCRFCHQHHHAPLRWPCSERARASRRRPRLRTTLSRWERTRMRSYVSPSRRRSTRRQSRPLATHAARAAR